MKITKQFIYGALIILLIVLFVFFEKLFSSPKESEYQNIEPIAVHTNGKYFAGSQTCAECHIDIFKTHIETAHYNSSAIANEDNIKGSFEIGKNQYNLNEYLKFVMDKKEDGFYQNVLYISDSTLVNSKKFDIVIGSGTKGQTYLSWKKNQLNQLQISYFEPTNSWINSPGYPTDQLDLERPIEGRCLECHATFVENTANFNKLNVYNKSNMVYGIDCERCHGPAAEHVNFHKKNPEVLEPKAILSYNDLNRQQKLDVCALCHSGLRTQTLNKPFTFMVGDTLNKYSVPDYDKNSLKDLDVHANQYGLLSASKCFIKSETMDCSTCHDVHKKQRNETSFFIQKCISCHSDNHEVKCAVDPTISSANGNNCIQCHMPLTPSKSMRVQTSTDSTLTSVKVRSHFIGVYKDKTFKSQ